MAIDFRKNKYILLPLSIKGRKVGRVETYKYLGLIINLKLN